MQNALDRSTDRGFESPVIGAAIEWVLYADHKPGVVWWVEDSPTVDAIRLRFVRTGAEVTVPVSHDDAEMNSTDSKETVVFSAGVELPAEHASDVRDGGVMVALERNGHVVSSYEPVLLLSVRPTTGPATQPSSQSSRE